MKEKAYITFLSTDNYIYYILALNESFKNTNSKYKLYCAVTNNVSKFTLNILDTIGLSYIIVDNEPIKPLINEMFEHSMVAKYVNALSKLTIFNLTQFEKCVFLDSDLVIFKNIDDLFDKPDWSAVEDCLPVHIRPQKYKLGESSFCSGMFVFSPNAEFYNKLLNSLKTLPKNIKWHDQAILAYHNQDWMQRPELHLPCEYDLLVAARENVLAEYLKRGGTQEAIKVKHYVSHKNAPYDKADRYYFNNNVHGEYLRYYKFINTIIDKYNLSLEPCHLENIYKKSESNINVPRNKKSKIDIVIPYVDSSDQNWVALFNKYNNVETKVSVNGKTRFRGQGNFFRYLFRGIDKNLKWVNNVFLLVQSESQVPKWLNKKQVHIVTHDKFIPAKYLPVFNSCAIEMFLWNIPGLSEQFVYLNDDFFALKYLTKEKFFLRDIPVFNLKHRAISDINSLYDTQCYNNYKLIYDDSSDSYLYVDHIFRPMLLSKVKECFNLYRTEIENSITRFRDAKNFNCYIYMLYQYKNGFRLESSVKTLSNATNYVGKSKVLLNKLLEYDTICLNDISSKNVYVDNELLNLFNNIYGADSKFELTHYAPKKQATNERRADGSRADAYLYF